MSKLHPQRLRLLGENLIVRPIIETKTAGGLHIPGEAQQRRADRAVVVRLGTGKRLRAQELAQGDVVIIEDFIGTGTPVEFDGVRHLIIDVDEVLAVVP